MSNTSEYLIPAADAKAVGLGVGRRTLGRRIKDQPEGFPTPIRINGRLYFRQSELDAYKEKLIREAFVENPRDTKTSSSTSSPEAA
jgi:predicted DNA-binding transcriptional regulator AlpA